MRTPTVLLNHLSIGAATQLQSLRDLHHRTWPSTYSIYIYCKIIALGNVWNDLNLCFLDSSNRRAPPVFAASSLTTSVGSKPPTPTVASSKPHLRPPPISIPTPVGRPMSILSSSSSSFSASAIEGYGRDVSAIEPRRRSPPKPSAAPVKATVAPGGGLVSREQLPQELALTLDHIVGQVISGGHRL